MSTEQEQPEEETEALITLLEELDAIDERAADAQSNKCSISDNNGGRIDLIRIREQQFPFPSFLAWLLPIFKRLKS
jgi:hypothetical protein